MPLSPMGIFHTVLGIGAVVSVFVFQTSTHFNQVSFHFNVKYDYKRC